MKSFRVFEIKNASRRAVFRAALLFSIFFPSFERDFAFASDNPVFTISSAVDRALDRNPDVLKGREAILQTSYDYRFAFAKVFPTVSGKLVSSHLKAAVSSGSALFGGDPYNQYLAELDLDQPLIQSGLLAGVRYSNKQKDLKQVELEIAERTLAVSVVENFYTILLNQELLAILKNTLIVDQETLAKAEQYFRIGRAQKIDVLQLRTQVAAIYPKIAQVESQIRTSAALLAGQLRDLDADSLRLKGTLSSPSMDWVKKTAEQHREEVLEVVRSRTLLSQFEDSQSVRMGVYWPTLDLLGKIGRQGYTKNELFEASTTYWSVSLQLNVPLFAGLSSIYQNDSLTSQKRQLEMDYLKTTDTALIGQIQYNKELEVAQSQLESSAKAAMYGRESLAEAQKSFRLQTINYLQYQSSHQAYLDGESTFVNAKFKYIMAIAKYFQSLDVPLQNLVSKLEEDVKSVEDLPKTESKKKKRKTGTS